MKTIVKTVLCLQLTALLSTVAFAGPGAAQEPVPFKGTLQAQETYDIQFPTLFVQSSGSGNATHLGGFTVTHEFGVDLPTFIALGSAQFIGADGSTIFTDTRALGAAPIPTDDPNVVFITELHTIIGGTGRFAGATGSFIVERLLNITGVTIGSFKGTIVLH
jgi:hypothetical protein